MAVAHSVIVATWHVLTSAQPYQDPGGYYFERRQTPETQTCRLVRQLEVLGHQVTLTPAA